MLLKDLLNMLDYKILNGDVNKNITAVTFDSRKAAKDSLFVAIKGFTVDGHDMIPQAIENGAAAAVVENDMEIDAGDVTLIKVQDTRDALARLSANFYENPSQSLNVIGITGTNGKTSITQFLNGILSEADHRAGIIGTMGTTINGENIETNNTTPESLDIQRFLNDMKNESHDYCLMEVSSHALNLKRAAYTSFHTGVFTNLSPDHLELHKTMDEYFDAKAILFDMTEKFNIINSDDFYGQQLIERLKNHHAETYSYGLSEKADFYATNIQYHFDHTDFTVHTPFGSEQITIHLPGEIYVSNSLAAIAVACCNGISLDRIKNGLNKVKNISGRFEVVYEKDDFKVIVDFAHTEDALQKTLSILRKFVKGKIIVVFGVYADMSQSGTEKRHGMGRIAAEYADFSVVTLDNPKHHDPELIIKETIESIERNKGKYTAIPDREEAIRHAIQISEKDDFILLAGKGHERTQVIGSQEIEFSEKDIVAEAMKEKVFN